MASSLAAIPGALLQAIPSLEMLAWVLIKVTALALVAFAVLWTGRGRLGATEKARVLHIVVIGALLVPILPRVLPGPTLPVSISLGAASIPDLGTEVRSRVAAISWTSEGTAALSGPATGCVGDACETHVTSSPGKLSSTTGVRGAQETTSFTLSLVHLLGFLWLAGTLVYLFRLALGFLLLNWLVGRRTEGPSERTAAVFSRLLTEAEVTRAVELRMGTRPIIPCTVGVFRTRIILPSDAESWSDRKLRAVVLHELGHTVRWDGLTRLLTQLALSLYWFHPLVRLAVRRLDCERELACDSWVLAQGVSAADYAEELVAVARDMLRGPRPSVVGIGFHSGPHLKDRVHALVGGSLQPSSSRGGASWWTAGAVIVGLAGSPSLGDLEAVVAPGEDGSPVSWSEDGTFRWEGRLQPGQVIEVKGLNADVNATPASGDQVEVIAVRAGNSLSDTLTVAFFVTTYSGGVTICALEAEGETACERGPWAEDPSIEGVEPVRFMVRVPEGNRLGAHVVRGHLTVDDISGHTKLRTVTGGIEARGMSSLDAWTVDGPLNASFIRTAWEGQRSLRTVNGLLNVRLPSGAALQLMARSATGTIRSPLSPPDSPTTPVPDQVEGVIRNADRSMEVMSVSGDIVISTDG